MLNQKELKDFLDEKYLKYNCKEFVEKDPIQIPHLFTNKNDIEISGFLAATIAWGQRPVIIRNAHKLIELMDNSPYDFILNFEETDLNRFSDFKHRTFNGADCIYFMKSLQNIYKDHGGLESVFDKKILEGKGVKEAIIYFREVFFELPHMTRTYKHVANVLKKSSAKRINMYLRWMVRDSSSGVDFGIWNNISPSQLYLPLDVHTGNVSRKLGILKRTQNDWQAVDEVTQKLRKLDPKDPVKYDFALFGLGIFEGF